MRAAIFLCGAVLVGTGAYIGGLVTSGGDDAGFRSMTMSAPVGPASSVERAGPGGDPVVAYRVELPVVGRVAAEPAKDDADRGAERRSFEGLEDTVREFVVQGIRKNWPEHAKAILAKVTRQGVHARNAEQFGGEVKAQGRLHKAAEAAFVGEAERLRDYYRELGDSDFYVQYPSSEALLSAYEKALKDGRFPIPDEEMGTHPDGTSFERWGLVVIDLDDRYPALKFAHEYLTGFDQFQDTLRDRSLMLLEGLDW